MITAREHGRRAGPELSAASRPARRSRIASRFDRAAPTGITATPISRSRTGVYGAIVIDPREPEPFSYDREHVVLLSDWTDRDPTRALPSCSSASPTTSTTTSARSATSCATRSATVCARRSTSGSNGAGCAWRRAISPTSAATRTRISMNGTPPAANWTGLFAPGERVRLRFINGSSMSYFDVRIPGLQMTVVAADGRHVRPGHGR